MKQFIVTIKHDNGTQKLRVPAVDEDSAKHLATVAEGCPESAIIRVKEAAYRKKESQPTPVPITGGELPEQITGWARNPDKWIRLHEITESNHVDEVVRRYNAFPELKMTVAGCAEYMGQLQLDKLKLQEQNKVLLEALKGFIYSVEHEGEIHGRIVGAIENAKAAIQSASK